MAMVSTIVDKTQAYEPTYHQSSPLNSGSSQSLHDSNELVDKTLPMDLTESFSNPDNGGQLNCSGSTLPLVHDDYVLHESQTDTDVTMCICPVCGYSASSPRGQDEHMETAHGDCYANFPSSSAAIDEKDNRVPSNQTSPSITVNSFAMKPLLSPEPSQNSFIPADRYTSSTPQNGVQTLVTLNLPAIHPVDRPLTINGSVESESICAPSECYSTVTTKTASQGRNGRSSAVNPLSDSSGDLNTMLPHKVDSRRRYRCNMCPATFPWHGDLTEHLRLVHGMQKTRESTRSGKAGSFCCVHCKYVAKYQSELRRHMRLHWGVKPFVCVFCPYRSAWKGDLKRHMESHHRERFSSEAELTKIMSQFKNNAGTTVNGVPLTPSSVEDAVCPNSMFSTDSVDHVTFSAHSFCGDDNENEITEHFEPLTVNYSRNSLPNYIQGIPKSKTYNKVRADTKQLSCSACTQRFTTKWDLKKHLKTRHPELSPASELNSIATPDNEVPFDDHPPFLSSSPDSLGSLGIEASVIGSSSEIPPKIDLPVPIVDLPKSTIPTLQTISHAWPVVSNPPRPLSFSTKSELDADSIPIDLSVGKKANSIEASSKTSTPASAAEKTINRKSISENEHLLSQPLPSFTAPVCLTPVSLMPTWLGSKAALQHPITGVIPNFPAVSNAVPSMWPTLPSGSSITNPGTPGPSQLFLNQWVLNGLMHNWQQQQSQQQSTAIRPPSVPLNVITFPTSSSKQTDSVDRKTETPCQPNSTLHSIELFTKQEVKTETEWAIPNSVDGDVVEHHSNREEDMSASKHKSFIHQQPRGRRMGSSYYGVRLSSSIGVKNEQWKRHQCSGCGHRSNWKWDINKHIKVAHPERTNITTITLDLEEAKRTFADYMNRLKLTRSRYSSDTVGRTVDTNSPWPTGFMPTPTTEPVGEGYYRPYKCSVCGHRSNWKWDVRKHIKHLHNNNAEVITLSLEEARRTIHQYKSCRRQQLRPSTEIPSIQRQCSSPDTSLGTNEKDATTTPIERPSFCPVTTGTAHQTITQLTEASTEGIGLPLLSGPALNRIEYHQSSEAKEVHLSPTRTPGGSSKRPVLRVRFACRTCFRRFGSRKAVIFHSFYWHRQQNGRMHNPPRSTISFDRIFRHHLTVTMKKSAGVVEKTRASEKSTPLVQLHLSIVDAEQQQRKPQEQQELHEPRNTIPAEEVIKHSPSTLSSTFPFRVRNSIQRRRVLRAARRSCIEFNPYRKCEPCPEPLRTHKDGNARTVPSRVNESTTVNDIVAQLSGLLDEVLYLLNAVNDQPVDKSNAARCETRQVLDKSSSESGRTSRNVIQHLADLIEETVSKNENISYMDQLNVSSSSNEENQGPTHMKNTVHDVVHHPAVENRLTRLATVLHTLSAQSETLVKPKEPQISSDPSIKRPNLQRIP